MRREAQEVIIASGDVVLTEGFLGALTAMIAQHPGLEEVIMTGSPNAYAPVPVFLAHTTVSERTVAESTDCGRSLLGPCGCAPSFCAA